MRIGTFLAAIACAAWVAGGMPAQTAAQGAAAPKAPEKDFIAVLDLEPSGVSKAMADAATDRLREELLRTGKYILVERNQMDELLKEQAFQQTGCTSRECAVQVGKILGVRKLVSGRLTKLDDTHWVLTASMIDVETAETLRSATVQHQGDAFSLLDDGARNLSARLTGVIAASATEQAILQSAVETEKKRTEAEKEYQRSPKSGIGLFLMTEDSTGTWHPASGPSVRANGSRTWVGADLQWAVAPPWALRLFYENAGGLSIRGDLGNLGYTKATATLLGTSIRYWRERAWVELGIGEFQEDIPVVLQDTSAAPLFPSPGFAGPRGTNLHLRGLRSAIAVGWEAFNGWLITVEYHQAELALSGTAQNDTTRVTSTNGTVTESGFALATGYRFK